MAALQSRPERGPIVGRASPRGSAVGVPATATVGPPAPGPVPFPPGDFPDTGIRPFTADSPWNTPIPSDAAIDPYSGAMIATIAANGALRSDPTQYTVPIYFADVATPRVVMTCSGTASTNNLDGSRSSSPTKDMEDVPIPTGAAPSRGTDAEVLVVDRNTGDEYDIFQFAAPNNCRNMTKYVRGIYRSAVENSYISRGAGLPYYAGLVRPWEIAQGHIDHALAFGYPHTHSTRCVWPASKTDGTDTGDGLPEGARIQLDPALDVGTIPGLSPAGQIIARALQVYGAYVVDTSGSNKLFPESSNTAGWTGMLSATTVSAIPVGSLRVLQLPDAYWSSGYAPTHGNCVQ